MRLVHITRDPHLFIAGRRVHHLLLGLLLAAIGLALAWDDRRDWRVAFRDFRKDRLW